MLENIDITIGIQESIDNIFGAVILGAIEKNEDNRQLLERKIDVFRTCRSMFEIRFPINIFKNEYAILYEIVSRMKIKTFTEEQLDAIVDNNRDLILDSPYVNKSDFLGGDSKLVPSDDDIINAMKYHIKNKFKELSFLEVTVDEFSSSCEIYTSWYKNAVMLYTSNNMTAIMSDLGFDDKLPGKRKRHYSGLEDAQEYYRDKMMEIEMLSDKNRISVYDINEDWLSDKLKTSQEEDNDVLIGYGIKEIDSTWGPLRRGNMLGIVGPPKGGKTRYTHGLTQRFLKHGLNVLVWTLDGDKEEWNSAITACIIADSSIEHIKKTGKGSVVRFSSKDILEKTYVKSPQMSKMVASAQTVLAIDPSYGRLSFIEGVAYVEDFDEILESEYKRRPFDVVIIDSLVNIQSKTGRGKSERVSDAYMKFKTLVNLKLPRKVLGVSPAQLKQAVVDQLRKNPDDTIDVTAGGESAETIRTPDYTLGLFSSKEERSADIMKFYCVATRHSASFDDFTARCFLDCCYFCSEEEAEQWTT